MTIATVANGHDDRIGRIDRSRCHWKAPMSKKRLRGHSLAKSQEEQTPGLGHKDDIRMPSELFVILAPTLMT
jgi:hypothetical protein